jgi:hypothetical protein
MTPINAAATADDMSTDFRIPFSPTGQILEM